MTAHGPLGILGGREDTAEPLPVDLRLLELLRRPRPLAVVLPLAAPIRRQPAVAASAAELWRRMGVDAVTCQVSALSTAECLAMIGEAVLLVLPGGHPRHLMAALGGSPLVGAIEAAWRRGAALSASSAGAMCLFQWSLRMLPPNPLRLVPGLGLLGRDVVAPHFDRARAAFWAATVQPRIGRPVLGLDESTGLVGTLDHIEVAGRGSVTVVDGGRATAFDPGDVLPFALRVGDAARPTAITGAPRAGADCEERVALAASGVVG